MCGVFMAKGEGRLNPQGEHRTCNMCFDESVTQSNNMPKLTFTIPMNRRLTRLRTAEPREVLGICTADQQTNSVSKPMALLYPTSAVSTRKFQPDDWEMLTDAAQLRLHNAHAKAKRKHDIEM